MKHMKKLLSLLLVLCLVLSLSCTAFAAGAEKPLDGKTVILHSNDVHGAIDLYAAMAALKADYEAQGAEIVGVDTSSEAIDLVLSGRADFLGTSVPVLNAYLDEHPDAKDKLKEAFVIPDSEDVIAIPARKEETEYLDAINAALAELREEGKLKEISEKYLGGDYTESAYQ